MNFLFYFFIFLFSNFQLNFGFVYNETIDREGNYRVSWEYEPGSKSILFEVWAKTTGWVGLGLSVNGMMMGADMIIGGVNDDNSWYFSDRHAIGNQVPIIDDVQNWHLQHASEIEGETYMKITRDLITCDDQDEDITQDLVRIIWSYGQSDTISQHIARGAKQFNLLDPPNPPIDNNYQRWPMIIDMEMPSKDTTYWTKYFKSPEFVGIHYIVGFDPKIIYETELAENHTHHLTIRTCYAPEKIENPDVFFEKIVASDGWDTDFDPHSEHCSAYLYAWAKGGKDVVLDKKLGFPVGEQTNTNYEYISIEVHFDNPEKLEGKRFKTGFDILYTKEARELEAGFIVLGLDLNPIHMIPPEMSSYMLAGHCGPQCTKEKIGPDGIKVFNVMFHAHLAARKMRLRHFRGNRELPWISSDQNYDFDYQQSRNLIKEITVLGGDQLTVECSTQTTGRNFTTLTGEATNEEMCYAFIWYYPKIPLTVCDSAYANPMEIWGRFGIEDLHIPRTRSEYFNPIVSLPLEMNGTRVSEVVNKHIWTDEEKENLWDKLLNGDHEEGCLEKTGSFPAPGTAAPEYSTTSNNFEEDGEGPPTHIITYPKNIITYAPLDPCKGTGNTVQSSIILIGLFFLIIYKIVH